MKTGTRSPGVSHAQVWPLWHDTVEALHYPPLDRDINVDVAVIGAGITGLTTAWHLARAGLKVAVLEAGRPGGGTTGSSTGNLYAPVGARLYNVEAKHNAETLQAVVSARASAIDFIEDRVSDHNIDCQFQRVPFYLFSGPDDKSAEDVEREFAAAQRAGLSVSNDLRPDFPFRASILTTVLNQAQFNPLRYVAGLAAAITGDHCRIYADTRVLDTEDGDPCVAHTNRGTVTARHIVKATHTPQGIYAVHTAMVPCREYAMVARLTTKPPADAIYWNANAASHYSIRPWRHNDEHFLIVLGQSRKPGEHKDGDLQKIEDFTREHFAIDDIPYVWAAQNYQSADTLPYIGTSVLEKRTWIATGFGADGLVYGTLAAHIISDAITGKQNAWSEIFDPKRFTPLASAKQFTQESIAVSRHLVKDYLFYGQAQELAEVAPGEGRTLKVDGERVAAYRTDAGELKIVSAVCTHLGCIVHFNKLEKSWDCPCHGSRFSLDGAVLEGPAQKDLAIPKAAMPPAAS